MNWSYAILLYVLACSGDNRANVEPKATPTARSIAMTAPQNAIVVATVNGDPIYDVELRVQAEARGVDARTALDDLVEMQLLAQEAARRGLAQDTEVIEESKQESVRLLIEREFHRSFQSPADIPDEFVRDVYNRPHIKRMYVSPENRTAVYTRVTIKKDADRKKVSKALAAAREIRRAFLAQRPKDGAAMTEIASAIGKTRGVNVDEETPPYTTPRHGKAVQSFAKALFSIKQMGDFSQVTRTKWGFDILQLTEIIPPKNVGYEQASTEIRKKIFATAQRQAFGVWMNKLLAKVHVTRSDKLLAKVDVLSALDIDVLPARLPALIEP